MTAFGSGSLHSANRTKSDLHTKIICAMRTHTAGGPPMHDAKHSATHVECYPFMFYTAALSQATTSILLYVTA